MKVQTYEEVFGEPLTIEKLVEGFQEDTKTGKVSAFGGKLNVRPPYQREFVYEIDKQKAVIDTVLKEYPLNVMYWAKNGDTYELMDGQQRTISLCKFFKDQFSVGVEVGGKVRPKTFSNIGTRKDGFLNYPLTIYICDGTDDEKLAWFRIINIAGVRLTDQEMRNAIYNGTWLTDAKKYFSRDDGNAYASEGHMSNGKTYGAYLDVKTGKKSEDEKAIVRQKLLEIVLDWAVDKYNKDNGLEAKERWGIDDYMDAHQKDENALELWRYYEDVLEWVKKAFPTYRDIMKKVDWGILYNDYKDVDTAGLDDKVNQILAKSDELSNISKVYQAVLADDMKVLNARAFKMPDKKWAYEKQGHKCRYCHNEFDDIKDLHGDHIIPWSKGGVTDRSNLQMLCVECNLKKSAYDVKYKPWDGREYEQFDLKKWEDAMEDQTGEETPTSVDET